MRFDDDEDYYEDYDADLEEDDDEDLERLVHGLGVSLPPRRSARRVRASRATFARDALSRMCLERAGNCGVDEGRRRRGLDYLFTGAVLDLQVRGGRIVASVQGTRRYRVDVEVLVPSKTRLQPVLERLHQARTGLGFETASLRAAIAVGGPDLLPSAVQMRPSCTCPDGPHCKHMVAAVYGFAACLDTEPELLLTLWGVDADAFRAPPTLVLAPLAGAETRALTGDLAALFDIDLVSPSSPVPRVPVDPPAPPPSASPEVSRDYLRVLGLPTRTIDAWLREGVLRRTGRHGVYERTTEASRRISERLAR